MPRLSTTLQHSLGRRKQLVLYVGQPEQMQSITLQAASPNLGGWKLGSEYHRVQEAAPVLARVQWKKWACFFWHSFGSCYMAGFLCLAFFRALHQVPRGFQLPAAGLWVTLPKSLFWVNTFHYRCVWPWENWWKWSNEGMWLLWVRGVCSPAGETWLQASTSPHETPKQKREGMG